MLSDELIHAIAISSFGGKPVPFKLCSECEYIRDKEGGYCYMFKDEPKGVYCGAFKQDENSPNALLDNVQ